MHNGIQSGRFSSVCGYCVVLNQIASEFLLGFIEAVGGEKDPRNLLVVFDLVPLIVQNISFGKRSEMHHSS